ncbi:DDE-type integrase/transposase/recombinase [Rhizophagus irregularis DAOM 181602=DAOM 197198]|nr:DDE-type integrase/transposase/recombinase [Rhizophagus irregularis DAOM 181602=DAOM 197198]
MAEARALETADAKEIARFIYEEIICKHGCPKKILSDRGSHFNNKLVKLNQAKENIEKSQEKQKLYHNKKNKIKKKFQIGDKVLYYDAAKEKQWSGKLEEKWKGPYYIHKKVSKGSYRIKTMEERIQKTPVNGELLKEYIDRSNFEVIIRI